MMMQFRGTSSIFRQIADNVANQILSGELEAGDRLASVREMAEALEVNPNTVQRSYTWMMDQEWLINKRGIGFFISDHAFELIKAQRRKEFMEDDLPQLVEKMDLIGIDFPDLETIYKKLKHNP
jgi:DNA-binding transcriptional regulator YhcF (GntR family)